MAVAEMKFEEGQMNLTPEQESQIAAEALEEKSVKKEPKDDHREEDSEATGSEDAQDSDVGKEADAEDRKDDKQDSEADVKSEEKVEEKPKADEARKKYIEDYAKSQNLTPEQATEEVAKNEAVIEKYGKDPVKLAAALRKNQSDFDKVRAENEKIKRTSNEPKIDNFASARSFVNHQIQVGGEKLIQAYRNEYPGLTETLSDEACTDLMRKEATEKVMARIEEGRIRKSSAAREKRNEIIGKFSDEDKPFLAEVKAVLDKVGDENVLADDFDAKDILYWAKGKNISTLLKSEFERGYKQGKEEPKIISEKVASKTGETKKPVTTQSKNFEGQLTKYEREQALNKFDGQPMSDEDKYKAYHEIYKQKEVKK